MGAKYCKPVIGLGLVACVAAGNAHATPSDVYRCDGSAKAARFTQYPCVGGTVVTLKPLAGTIDSPAANALAPPSLTPAQRGSRHRQSRQRFDHAARHPHESTNETDHATNTKTDQTADTTPACLMHREHERLLRLLHGAHRAAANRIGSSGSGPATNACGDGASGNPPQRAKRAARKPRGGRSPQLGARTLNKRTPSSSLFAYASSAAPVSTQ